jgi:hypothetical protein
MSAAWAAYQIDAVLLDTVECWRRPSTRATSISSGVGVQYGSPQVLEFLLNRGAGRLPHSGGTLHEHLMRVGALLAEWGEDEACRRPGCAMPVTARMASPRR